MNIELKQALSLYIESITDLSGYDDWVTLSEVIHLESNGDVNNWLRGLPSCLDVVFWDWDCTSVVLGWEALDSGVICDNSLEGLHMADVYFKVLAAFLAD